MDYKKSNAPLNTVTRDLMALCRQTGNIYETVSILGKRANQIAVDIKNELDEKKKEFSPKDPNTTQEVAPNPEQEQISKFYEKLPKPTLIATQEYIEHKLYFTNPAKERDHLDD